MKYFSILILPKVLPDLCPINLQYGHKKKRRKDKGEARGRDKGEGRGGKGAAPRPKPGSGEIRRKKGGKIHKNRL